MAKKTKKQIRNKDILRSKKVHLSIPPRMEGKVKNAMVRSKRGLATRPVPKASSKRWKVGKKRKFM